MGDGVSYVAMTLADTAERECRTCQQALSLFLFSPLHSCTGRTAVHWAAVVDNLEALKLLIRQGPDTIKDQQDSKVCSFCEGMKTGGFSEIQKKWKRLFLSLERNWLWSS